MVGKVWQLEYEVVAWSHGIREEAESIRTGRILKDPCRLTSLSQLTVPLKFTLSSKDPHSLENICSEQEPMGTLTIQTVIGMILSSANEKE